MFESLRWTFLIIKLCIWNWFFIWDLSLELEAIVRVQVHQHQSHNLFSTLNSVAECFNAFENALQMTWFRLIKSRNPSKSVTHRSKSLLTLNSPRYLFWIQPNYLFSSSFESESLEPGIKSVKKLVSNGNS
jgi:hypothetical protein